MNGLPEGKVGHDILKEITNMTGFDLPGIVQKPLPGIDVGVLDTAQIKEYINEFYGSQGDPFLVYKADPITFPTDRPGWYLITVNENDIATAGAKAIAMTVTMLIPPGMDKEAVLEIQQELNDIAKARNITILGGHSEVTSSVNRIILSGNMIGLVPEEFYISQDVEVGDVIILSGWVGAEGTGILLSEGKKYFQSLLTADEYKEGVQIGKEIQISDRVLEVVKHHQDEISMIHDVTEGGLLTALYESIEPLGLGIEINSKKLNISPVTSKICNDLHISPLELIGSGAVLLYCPQRSAKQIIQTLSKSQYPVSIIGRVTSEDKFTIDDKEFSQVPDALIDGLSNLTTKLES